MLLYKVKKNRLKLRRCKSIRVSIWDAIVLSKRGAIHIGFMGDPTLRDYMIKSVSHLTVAVNGNSVTLAWTDSENSKGYYVYSSSEKLGTYKLLNTNPISAKGITFSKSLGDKFYMVRSVKTADTFGGQFKNLSMGSIVELP